MAEESGGEETRQQRRERRLAKRREAIKKHGANLAQVYRNAVLKRAAGAGKRRRKR